MQLNSTLLNDADHGDMFHRIDQSSGTKGIYNHIFYTLRLHPDVYKILRMVEAGEGTDYSPNEISQALSTLFHENTHWWQYIGSISGLIMSLNLPAQVIFSLSAFKEYIKMTGPKKPIITYSDNNQTPLNTDTKEFNVINLILNNFHDVKYFKGRIKRPIYVRDARKEKYFKSVGHVFHIAYSTSLGLLESTFDQSCSFIPDANKWYKHFRRLEVEKVNGFHDDSKYTLPPIGTEDLYEGQAIFNQIIFLHIRSDGTLNWSDFESAGMLHTVYVSAFNCFLEVLEEKRPDTVKSPLVALFLLLIDIAINPAEGFPFDIVDFERFPHHADPGTRFLFLCRVVKDKFPEFKASITDYSSEEYYMISTILCEALGLYSPAQYLRKFVDWCDNEEKIIALLKENDDFIYSDANHLVRLIFGRFLSFQKDKFNNPEIFCWPGVYLDGGKQESDMWMLYKKHQAIFKENKNGDIAPAYLPGIDEETLANTAGQFYGMLTVFELCRQWALDQGDFKYNLQWVSKSNSKEETEDWMKKNFFDVFGISPDSFEIVTPNQDV